MTTLVTGATGFLGSHVARLLLERGEQRARAGAPVERYARSRRVCLRSACAGDLRDPASLDRALRWRDARLSRGRGLSLVGARPARDLRIECDRHAESARCRAARGRREIRLHQHGRNGRGAARRRLCRTRDTQLRSTK